MNPLNYCLEQTKLKESKVFRDAIHNYIYVDQPLILELIDTPEMQRLKRIKQLGGVHQVYQSAEHSRFTHSLGVYHVVLKMINDTILKDVLSDYDKLTVMCAALLHDIGHGPFSHCFEEVFKSSHEEYTIRIINGHSQVHQVLESFHQGFSKQVSSIITKEHPNKILVQMVSSQLDCDRMDYLLRDSHFTGTIYGHFDMARILRVLRVYDGKIVFKESGVQAIENYILARYHMYWQVYYHPMGRSYEQILMSIFKRIKDLYLQGFDLGDIRYLVPFINGNVSEADYLKLDESIILYYFTVFKESKDPILADLCDRFLNRRLFNYCDLVDADDIEVIKKRCIKLGYDPKYYVLFDDQSQIPYFISHDELSEIEILVNGKLRFLPEVSEIVGAIIKAKKNKDDQKIFYPEG
ncbi:MAG: HD domain-containing protein [Thomasclavelia sp.]